MKRLPIDWFMGGMIAAVVLAWAYPAPGAAGGWMYPEITTKAGVALIFFLHGAGLSFAALSSGALRWRLHLLVQATTFLVFPILGLVAYVGLEGRIDPSLRLGVFFLCALPSTVSSSVALTAAAHGNVAAAVFNATLSNLIGVFLTPLWIGGVLSVSGANIPVGPVILDLVRWLVVPLALGQLCRPAIGSWIVRHKGGVHVVDRLTILMLVYTSFCDSFANGVWSGHGVGTILGVLVGAGALFALVMAFTSTVARRLGFPQPDIITAMFCGSKKTLASGVPMAKLMFGSAAGVGMILLPIMIYHQLQLIACGLLVNAWNRRNDAK